MPSRIGETSDLVGGRYCSLQGELAAQLRLERRSDGRSGTLYIVRRSPQLEEIGQTVVQLGDFEIELWHDDSRFFALAFELPHQHGHEKGASGKEIGNTYQESG